MKRLFFLTYACLFITFTSTVFATENDSFSTNINKSQIIDIKNTNVNSNTNTNTQSQKQKQENHQTQEVNITNSAQSAPAIVRSIRKPIVQPKTGVSGLTLVLMLGTLPLGFYLARHKVKD